MPQKLRDVAAAVNLPALGPVLALEKPLVIPAQNPHETVKCCKVSSHRSPHLRSHSLLARTLLEALLTQPSSSTHSALLVDAGTAFLGVQRERALLLTNRADVLRFSERRPPATAPSSQPTRVRTTRRTRLRSSNALHTNSESALSGGQATSCKRPSLISVLTGLSQQCGQPAWSMFFFSASAYSSSSECS